MLLTYHQLLILFIELITLYPVSSPSDASLLPPGFSDLIYPLFDDLSSRLLGLYGVPGGLSGFYPQLHFQSLSLLFTFKARYAYYPDNLSDERLFYSWEELCKTIHPADWDVGEGYVFQEQLKRVYEKYGREEKHNRSNIDDVMKL